MGADDGLIGMNGCLLTYDPQIYRYTGLGQIVSQDFCFTIEEMKPGSIVSFDKGCCKKNYASILSNCHF